MNEDVRLSRLRVSRRRALSIGGTVGLSGVLAACGSSDGQSTAATGTPSATATAATGDARTLLDAANTCTLAAEQTQGPYWFDVDSIRSDIREDRPGVALTLALRVQDVTACSSGGAATPVANSVVEIWHCDAGGIYSGFESASTGAGGAPDGGTGGPPPSGGPGGGPDGPPPSGAAGAPNPAGGAGPGRGSNASGETSDGSYSLGDPEAATSDDGTYLRGAQVADADGIVQFTTIYPGWYRGRTTHIHCKVHVDRKTVRTTQLYFDDAVNDEVYSAVAPYDEHTGRDTRNDSDSIYDASGVATAQKSGDGYLAALNLGVDV